MTLKQYIEENLPKSIRYQAQDSESLYALPYPYLIPSVKGMFQEMYYWDTYFANTALLMRGDLEQAKNTLSALLASEEAQALVKKLQGYITEHFYNCTDAILAGLGEMYVADDRFRSNIDRHGEGTAEFIRQAIQYQ